MTINKLNFRDFATSQLQTYDLSQYGCDKEIAINELENEISEEFHELNTVEVMMARFERFKVDGVEINDFAERVLELDEWRSVIYGIRHMNGNKEVPFINLIPNFKLRSKEDALEIYELIKGQFHLFKPQFLRFFHPKKIEADFYGDTYMCIKAQDLFQRDKWDIEDEIEFIQIEDDSYYEWYENGYARFNEMVPELAYKVKANSEEIMTESLKEGLLHYAYYQGEKIGLIAAVRSQFLSHDGFYFNEIFIDEHFKGRGLAKAIQRKFIVNFAGEGDIVWGTIDANNLASYNTAYSNGRRPTRFECFVKT